MMGKFELKNRISRYNQSVMSNKVFDRMTAPDSYDGDPFDEVDFSFEVLALSGSVDFADNFSNYLFQRTKDLRENERNSFIRITGNLVKEISYLLTNEEDIILPHIKPGSSIKELGIDMDCLYGGIFCAADKEKFYNSKNVADIVESIAAKELLTK